jgi:hypothetical protein
MMAPFPRLSSGLGFLDLPSDIHIIIMADLDSLTTLRNLLLSFPTITTTFSVAFGTITKTILKNAMLIEKEVYQYLYAIVAANSTAPLDKNRLEAYLNFYMGQNANYPPPTSGPGSHISLEYMISVLEAVEFFLEDSTFVWKGAIHGANRYWNEWARYYKYHEQMQTDFHMRLTLLRIQLYIELFHQPGDSEWIERPVESTLFWNRYGELDIKKCKYLYATFLNCVEFEMEYRPAPTEPHQDIDLIQHRGLPQLQMLMEDPPSFTKFGSRYIRQFVQTCMRGLDYVGPPDDICYYAHVKKELVRWPFQPPMGPRKDIKPKFEPSRIPREQLEALDREFQLEHRGEKCVKVSPLVQVIHLRFDAQNRLMKTAYWTTDPLAPKVLCLGKR